MKLKINNTKKIATLQKEFNAFFPFLKLDFFGGGQEYGTSSSTNIQSNNEKTIGEFRKIQYEGDIIILPEMSVSDLEKIFMDSFGLSVKVLRSAGNTWVQPSYSNFWSLEKQNIQGELTSKNLRDLKAKRNP